MSDMLTSAIPDPPPTKRFLIRSLGPDLVDVAEGRKNQWDFRHRDLATLVRHADELRIDPRAVAQARRILGDSAAAGNDHARALLAEADAAVDARRRMSDPVA